MAEMRAVWSGEPERFAENLGDLIRLVGRRQRQVAEEMGVTYKLVRRFCSGGLGQPNRRSYDNLEKVVGYFCLPNMGFMWRDDLVEVLLTTEAGQAFVKKFRPELKRRMAKEQAKSDDRNEELLGWLSIALQKIVRLEPKPPMTHLDKARAILESDSKQASAYRTLTDVVYADLMQRRRRTGTC